eukprot:TRINITY_DN2863_c0_g1_i3.p1 TRINITY_DN2863_c0_g1~~TRINITY_DN2863_c0_g1_i3.p1  ORF type:complete len:218 (-),score=43.99 TRINITY_DN2863_c0_g1_i3:79-732(-)
MVAAAERVAQQQAQAMEASTTGNTHLEEALKDLKLFNAKQKFKVIIFAAEATHRMQYITKCKELGIKTNSALVQQLQAPELTTLDLNSNYLGTKGLQAALAALSESTTVHTVKLRDNQIDNNGVTIICDLLKNHPSVTSVDLSNNPISQLAARHLLALIQTNHLIIDMKLDGTFVKPTFMTKIDAQLGRNKARTGRYVTLADDLPLVASAAPSAPVE